MIYALSDALDLVGVDDVAHGKRVGIMAAECCRTMGCPEDEVTHFFDLGMLHDIGVSSTRMHRHLVEEFDWAGSQAHAIAGAELLARFAPLAHMAPAVRYHHTRWDRMVAEAVDPAVARAANLVLLADRVDALAAPYYATNTALLHKASIRQGIRERAGTYFAPELVEGFLAASDREAFWLLTEPRAIRGYLQDMLSRGKPYLADMEELKRLAALFAFIVDAKSPFTAAHSLGVARVARLLASRLGVGENGCDKLEIAGLLHDLGKLRVPDEILDKPARLDAEERLVINTHSFETYQILHGIQGFEEIARWASWHHEEPDGTGYPFRLTQAEMPLEARILRVADIFQAMVQDRPYRPGLDAAAVTAFMTGLADAGRIDRDVFDALSRHLGEAMVAARPPATSA